MPANSITTHPREAKDDANARIDAISDATDDSSLVSQDRDTVYDQAAYKVNPALEPEEDTIEDDALEEDNLYSKSVTQPLSSDERDPHEVRVLAGYKATLHNPRVSDEAKQHAEEVLAEKDAL